MCEQIELILELINEALVVTATYRDVTVMHRYLSSLETLQLASPCYVKQP